MVRVDIRVGYPKEPGCRSPPQWTTASYKATGSAAGIIFIRNGSLRCALFPDKKIPPATSPKHRRDGVLQTLENLVGDGLYLAAVGLDDQVGDVPVHRVAL